MLKDNFCTDDGSILTYSGKLLNLYAPQIEKINIEDIAHGLSNLCRFGGQVSTFYSVAEHSIHCALLAPAHLKLIGLLHDATEAYLIDLPRPIKLQLAQYRKFEDNLAVAIFKRFGLQYDLLASIKDVDNRMLTVEAYHLMKQDGEFVWPECHDKDMKLSCLSPKYAKRAFLDLFYELTGSPVSRGVV